MTWADETRTSRAGESVDPGPVATRLRAAAMPGEDPRKLAPPAEVAPGIADLCGPVGRRGTGR